MICAVVNHQEMSFTRSVPEEEVHGDHSLLVEAESGNLVYREDGLVFVKLIVNPQRAEYI